MNEEEQEYIAESEVPEGTLYPIPGGGSIEVAPIEQSPQLGLTARGSATAERAGGRVGAAARRLFEDVGEKLESQEQSENDLSDLFEGPDMERDNDVYTRDLTMVTEEDVFGEGGADMSDLLEVDESDVMGEESEPESHPPIRKPKYKPIRQQPLPGGLTGLRI